LRKRNIFFKSDAENVKRLRLRLRQPAVAEDYGGQGLKTSKFAQNQGGVTGIDTPLGPSVSVLVAVTASEFIIY